MQDYSFIQLAGIYIPWSEEINYREELVNNLMTLLKGREIRYKIIEKGKKVDKAYPYYDLAVVYIDNDKKSVNEKLLSDGMAFFDQGYCKGKDKYADLEKETRKNKSGIWRDNSLTVLYIGSKRWWTFHYPECPEVKKIKEEDRIYYYFYPINPFYYNRPDLDCRYCRAIEKKFKRPLLFRLHQKEMEGRKMFDKVD